MKPPETNPDKILSRANPLVLTRKAIACGQLESAIYLWFLEKDVVSIHTLASAALEVINGVGPKERPQSIIWGNVRRLPKAERAMVTNKVTKAQNLFKHASKDASCRFRFPPEISEFVMYDGVRSYLYVFHELTPLMAAFAAHFCISWGGTLGGLAAGEGLFIASLSLKKPFAVDKFIGLTRKKFLKKSLGFFVHTNGFDLA